MAQRRSYGTGSLVERPKGSGRWQFRFSLGTDPVTGQHRRGSTTIVARTKTEAQALAQQFLTKRVPTPTDSTAVLNQLLDDWMRFQASRGRSPTTLSGYRSLIANHIEPTIGNVRIGKLTPYQLDSLYAKLTANGRSPRTVRNVHNVISAALNQAVKWDWIDRNPATRATLPKGSPASIAVPDADETQLIISFCQQRNETVGAFVFLAAVTGCRRGELAALRWRSVEGATLRVRESAYSVGGQVGIKATKSGRERVIQLDPAVGTWLESWRQRQEKLAIDWGVIFAEDGFIFSATPDGSRPINLDLVSRAVRKAANSIGKPALHLHSLRHFAATELLAAGISPRDTADMLGHADPALTLRTYAHATAERQRAASRVLARTLSPPAEQVTQIGMKLE